MSKEVNTIEFAQDTEERRRWFRAASFSHPAKMVLGLQIYLIEHYTKVGETILDPMAGSGTVLVGCALGRNIICVELEQKFVDMQKANWEKIRSLGSMLGYKMGEATIFQGDARNLNELLVDKIVTSPPYAAAQTGGGIAKAMRKEGHYKVTTKRPIGSCYQPREAGQSKGQISNLPYGEISAVISSPPYTDIPISSQGADSEKQDWNRAYKEYKETGDWHKFQKQMTKQNKESGYAEAIITSPPYEGSLETSSRNTKGGISARDPKLAQTGTYANLDESVKRLRNHGRTDPKAGGPYGQSLAHPYSSAAENIGNLKSENYLEAMLAVYENCHRVLRDGGLLCLVVKNFIREKKIIRLDTDTIKLCEKAGFVLKERLKRKLTQQSFWRIIYQKKFPDAPKIEFEDVLIFAKARPERFV